MEKPEGSFRIGITAKLKHGDLLAAIRKRGWTQRQAAEYFGMSDARFGTMINLRWIPKSDIVSEEFTKKIFALTGKLPEDLWPEFIRTQDFLDLPKRLDIYREVTARQLSAMVEQRQLGAAPDELLAAEELKQLVREKLEELSPRERQVLIGRFFEDKTLEQIGSELGLKKQTICKVEGEALRRLRHPGRCRVLKPFY